MCEDSSAPLYTAEDVVHLLTEDDDEQLDDIDYEPFYPGSDDEFGFLEEVVGDESDVDNDDDGIDLYDDMRFVCMDIQKNKQR